VSALVAEGAIGAVRSVSWKTLRTQPAAAAGADGVPNWRVDPARAGGGVLVDHGWHALYCVARWAGHPLAVSALLETRRFDRQPVEDTASIELRTASGASRIFLTWAAEARSNLIEIAGERGRISAEGDIVTVESDSRARAFFCPPSLSDGSQHPDWFDGVADEFLAAASGRGLGNLHEAMMCAELIDLAQRSSAAGGIELPVGG
jgi:predicted dehydrogenase